MKCNIGQCSEIQSVGHFQIFQCISNVPESQIVYLGNAVVAQIHFRNAGNMAKCSAIWKKQTKEDFFRRIFLFAIYHGWTLYLPISTKLALTKFSSSNPGAKGLNWLSVTRPWYRIPGSPTFRMFRIKPTSRRGTNPMSSPDKDKSFKENLNPINDAFGDTLNMLSLSLRLLIISKSSKRVSGKSFSLEKKNRKKNRRRGYTICFVKSIYVPVCTHIQHFQTTF